MYEDKMTSKSEVCSSDKDYEIMLKIAKDKYEQRLEAITDKVRLIYEEVRRDEVLATMREDPASNAFASQRVLEICEDNLALEREEAIERLMAEATHAQAQVKRLERDSGILRAALLAAEEKLSTERLRLHETHSVEMKNKLTAISKDYESQFHGELEAREAELGRVQAETESFKRTLEQKECDLWKKSAEYEVLLNECAGLKQNLAEAAQRTAEEKTKLEREHAAQLEQVRGELQQHNQSKALLAQEQQYKSKSSRLKKKIIEQKATIAKFQREVEGARTALEQTKANYEKSLLHVQEDLTKVRDTWEQRCSELQREHNSKVSELQSNHQTQLRELQLHYQGLLDEKLTEFQTEASNQLSRQKLLDAELAQKVDERIKEFEKTHISKATHEQVLAETTSQLKSLHFKELRDVEEQQAKEFSERARNLRDDHRQQIEKLNAKFDQLDEEKSAAVLEKRQLANDLEYANQKVEMLNSRLASLNEDLTYLESSKRNLMQTIEEHSLNLTKYKGLYEEESMKKTRYENELLSEREKHKEAEHALNLKCHELSLKHTQLTEELSQIQTSLANERTNAKQLKTELKETHDKCEALEREKENVAEAQSRDSMAFTQKVRAEESLKLEKEIAAHVDTQALLKEAEAQITTLSDELERVRAKYQHCRSTLGKQDTELVELKQQLTDHQSLSFQDESRLTELQKQYTRAKQTIGQLKYTAQHTLKTALGKLKGDLSSLSRRSLQELTAFKATLVEDLGDALGTLERTHSSSKQTQERQLHQKTQEIHRLSKMLQDSQDTLNLSIQEQASYETNMKGLKDTIAALKREVNIKKQEVQAFENNLEDFQSMRRSLEKENRKLQQQLRTTQDSFEQYKQESIEIQAKVVEQEDVQKEVSRLQAELKRQQSAHAKEIHTLTSELESVKDYYEQRIWQDGQQFEDAYALKEQLQTLELKASGIMDRLQSDLVGLHESIADEKMQHQRFKAERLAEAETLRDEVKGLNGDIQLKNDIIERLEQENQQLRRHLRDPNSQELQELRGKLAQSYQSTIQTVKQAKALERETHQLSVQARAGRSNGSVSQLKASLEKY